ncbi:hypothetical protein PINS_up001357 [Pythium insidiosum]|nr:hypothetical protein PINS_up001357 [Pythium insidiosum]
MQTKAFVTTVAAALALLAASAPNGAQAFTPGKVKAGGGKNTSPKKQPGFCLEPKDCKVAGYECVALQTTREGTEEVKQCLPKKAEEDVCAGQYPGLCPSFSSWTEPYKLINSVCTYRPAKKCAKDPTGESVKGEVVCVPNAKDADGNPLQVIYGCVDVDITNRKVGFTDKEDSAKLALKLKTVDAVMETCLNPKARNGTGLLCSGHGTCVTSVSGSLEYKCRCNVGYSGDFCDMKDSNKCALPGQCSAGECNLEKQACECPAGTTGNQCADCDSTSDKACNGNGKCNNKQCTCNDGFFGDHCDKEVKTPAPSKAAASTKDGSSASATTPAPSSSGAIATGSMLLAATAMAVATAFP